MASKSNKILIGIILLIIGIISLMQNYLKLNYGNFALIIAGVAFLLLYLTKKKSWSLFVGVYLTCFGVNGFLRMFNSIGLPNFTGALFFIAPGIVFIVMFLDLKKRNMLAPGSFLIWFGLYIMAASSGVFSNNAMGGLFFVFIGLSFITIYVLSKNYIKKVTLFTGMIFAFFGLTICGGMPFTGSAGMFRKLPGIGSISLIFLSLAIIFSEMRKK